jgi:hypothetical protein
MDRVRLFDRREEGMGMSLMKLVNHRLAFATMTAHHYSGFSGLCTANSAGNSGHGFRNTEPLGG